MDGDIYFPMQDYNSSICSKIFYAENKDSEKSVIDGKLIKILSQQYNLKKTLAPFL